MPALFQVESDDIKNLSDIQLTKLLKLLLHQEAQRFDIAQRAVDVALNITVPDGGEDGRISWKGEPESTSFLPSNLVQFQNKATEMGPTDCAKEILKSDGTLKPMVEEVLDSGGSYILFTTQQLNGSQKQERKDKIRAVLAEQGKGYAETVDLQIYDASTIEGWVNQYISAIVAVLNWVGRPLERGLKTWEDWSQCAEYQRFEFVTDPFRNESIASLRKLLLGKRECARIIGLSGMGKTRLAFETFKDTGDYQDISKRVVYLDAKTNPTVHGLLSDWVQVNLEGIIVVDNCAISLHDKLREEVKRANSKLSLLTLDFNLERASQTEIIHLKRLPDEQIKEMLQPVYGKQIEDLDRIVKFAQGFPQMAVLLADARLDREPEMGRLSDDELANKMLWGGKQASGDDECILRGCALFDKFGIDGDASSQYEFIAASVVKVDLDKFYECVMRFEERGLIDRRGRYVRLVPKPLAIRFAAEWWRRTRPETQKELILSDMPGSLLDSFCDQIALMDFLPEVKDLTSGLCGEQGPFGQAEVILSCKGSRLFRALSEVNPSATGGALFRILYNYQDIKGIVGEVRRNLINALENICFHKSCFEVGANALLILAIWENETWSNNSTGIFKQLFGTFLSGTEAPPELRFRVLDGALKSEDGRARKIAIEALAVACEATGQKSVRMVGAEYQGSGEPLKEWRPKVWQEAFDYWEEALERLYAEALKQGPLATLAKSLIAKRIRGLVQYGRVEMLDKVLKGIVDKDGPLWDQALDSIKTCLSYDKVKLPDEGVKILEEWVILLTPKNLEERLYLIVTNPPFEHEENKDGEWVDIAAQNARLLAEEISNEWEVIIPYIKALLIGEQRQAYWFGKCLVLSKGKWNPLLDEAISLFQQIDVPNGSFIYGLLNGVSVLDATKWEEIVNRFSEEEKLYKHYPSAVASGEVTEEQLNVLLSLVRDGLIGVNSVTILSYGGRLNHLETDIIIDFISRFYPISNESAWISLDMLSRYCHGDSNKWEIAKNTFKNIVVSLNLGDEKKGQSQLEMYHWESVSKKLLESEGPDFSKMLVNQIINYATEIGYGDIWHHVQPLLRMIFQKHGAEVWPIFSEAIKDSEGLTEYRLLNLFCDSSSFDQRRTSIIADLPEEH